ncbi:hypothetical protein D3C76_1231010 [compost metagenome]
MTGIPLGQIRDIPHEKRIRKNGEDQTEALTGGIRKPDQGKQQRELWRENAQTRGKRPWLGVRGHRYRPSCTGSGQFHADPHPA